MFEPGWSSATDATGAFLVDRSPDYFEPLLNFLRHGKLILNDGVNPQGNPAGHTGTILTCLCVPAGVLEEAKFFGISKAIEPLEAMVQVSLRAVVQVSLRAVVQVSLRATVQVSLRATVQVSLRATVQVSLRATVQVSLRATVQVSLRATVQVSLRATVQVSLRATVQVSLRATVQVILRATESHGSG